ncbi:MAG: hypothetical protein QXU40_01220 [Candidatus Pacearchaeota archaeon]
MKKTIHRVLSGQAKRENLLYIKFNYLDAISSKRNLLILQMSLLKLAKKVEAYKAIKEKESKTKTNFSKNIKEIKSDISYIKKILPQIEIREKIEKEKSEVKQKTEIKKEIYEPSIEEQLKEIERKIEELQRKTVY